MKKHIIGIMLIVMLCTAPMAMAEGGAFDAENFSATLYLTTDYVSRGLTYSDGKPALQGTIDYAHPIGVFAGIWASSWHSYEASNDLETGYYAGYGGAFGDFTYSAWASYYDYPGANDSGAEWNYFEFSATGGYTFSQMPLTPTLGVGYTFSPNFSGEDGQLHYANTTADLVLPWKIGLGMEVGYFNVAGDKTTGNGAGKDGGDGYDYFHWRVGVSYTLVGFGLDLSYHNTSEHDYFVDNGDERLVFTVSRSF